MANRLFSPYQQFFDNTGNVLSGGTLTFYETATTTPLATYSDDGLTTPNSNPITLDSAGRIPSDVWGQAQDYKIVLKDSGGTEIWTADPVQGSLFSTSFASQVQAEAGTDTATYMNPLRTAQAIAALETTYSAGTGLDLAGTTFSADLTDIDFDNATSGLTATKAKAAIDELAARAQIDEVMWFKDVKADTTAGGSFTSGSWVTRVLNTTENSGAISGASLGSNQITLPAGTYEIDASAPAYRVARHQARLYNATDASETILGTVEYSNSASDANAQSRSFIRGVFTIATTKAFEIQHQCQTTHATEGFGRAGSFGSGEIFTTVKIRKL